MPLYDKQGRKQNATGKKPHWKNIFEPRQGSPLHLYFMEQAAKHLREDDYINSGQLGRQILRREQKTIRSLAGDLHSSFYGKYWGMVLWHTAATQGLDWAFSKETLVDGERQVVHYQRQ